MSDPSTMGAALAKPSKATKTPTPDSTYFQYLQALSKESSGKLEEAFQYALQFLEDVKSVILVAQDLPEVPSWLRAIGRLQEKARPQRVVVGVVGGTGAGKSSVINAVLDEEDLLPTNCMRACTAAITEVSYNTSDDPSEKYRAEIEFISAKEWAKELDIFWMIFTTDRRLSGLSLSAPKVILVSLIRKFEPCIQHSEFNPEKLVNDKSVEDLFGSPSAAEFVTLLRSFVDSREKGRRRPKEIPALQTWPLIKVVRAYARSEILRTGLVLVNLPGVQDSNAARSGIAAKYIEKCSGLWVVAPINRAVDDLAAKQLLGKAFKRQLRFDGTYSAVTVICSKTDDISETELLKTLPEQDEAHQISKRLRLVKATVAERKKGMASVKKLISEMTLERSVLQNHLLRVTLALQSPSPHPDDKIVLRLPPASRKRSGLAAANDARKRCRRQQQDYASDEPSDFSADDELSIEDIEPKVEEVSRDVTVQRLNSLQEQMDQLETELQTQKGLKMQLENVLTSFNGVVELLRKQRKGACIRFRNSYTKPELQRHLDEEDASYDDDYKPDEPLRDYAEVARKLPVFCVSSNAYHKLMGRLEEDESLQGFTTVDDTQIPALKQHALDIVAQTEGGLYRHLLRGVHRFLMTLHMRIAIAGRPYKLADEVKDVEVDVLTTAITELQTSFDSMIEKTFNDLDEIMEVNVFRKLAGARLVASDISVTTVEKWFSPPRSGGYVHSTLRATCVRDGVYNSKRGLINFNQELADPILSHLSTGWERVFSEAVNRQFECLADSMSMKLRDFNNLTTEREVLKKLHVITSVKHQMNILEKSLNEVSKLNKQLNDTQKSASRMFISIITDNMLDAYHACKEETGGGCFKRMRGRMINYIQAHRAAIFKAATAEVEKTLRAGVYDCREKATGKGRSVITSIGKEYKRILYEEHRIKISDASKQTINNLLISAEQRFKEISHGLYSTLEADTQESVPSIENGAGQIAAHSGDMTPPPADGDAFDFDHNEDGEVVTDEFLELVKREENEQE